MQFRNTIRRTCNSERCVYLAVGFVVFVFGHCPLQVFTIMEDFKAAVDVYTEALEYGKSGDSCCP